MKKNRMAALLCIFCATAVLAGCSFGVRQTGNVDNENLPQTTASDETRPSDGGSKTDDNEQTDPPSTDSRVIAISFPDASVPRWASDAENMKQGLEALGYQVQIQYAQNEPKRQAEQIMEFAAGKVDCVVAAPVNDKKLKKAAVKLQKAKIPLIAYDSLPMDTDAVSFLAAFDHKGIGNSIGKEIVKKAGLDDLADGEYRTAEFFMGPKDDPESLYLYQGLMEVLQPYLDQGILVSNTARTSFEDTAIADWSQETAKQRCENYLEGYYTQEDLDICITAYDGFAYGCKEAFMAAGYTQDNWPVVSGVGSELAACKNILDGTQSFTVCKDSRVLAAECVEMVDALMNGEEPEVNNAQLYDNHVMIVPAHLCGTSIIDADNLQEVLIDGGYYTQQELDG